MPSEQVEIALIGAVSSTIAVLLTGGSSAFLLILGRRIKRVKADTEASVEQLVNDHVKDPEKVSNLRENIDSNHRVTTETATQVKELTYAVRALTSIVVDNTTRIGRVEESTTPRPGRHRGE